MKHLLFVFLFLIPAIAFAQWPNNPNKLRLGFQTTGDGLVYRAAGVPSYTPVGLFDAWMYLDTTSGTLYAYRGGSWQAVSGGGGGGDGIYGGPGTVPNNTIAAIETGSTFTLGEGGEIILKSESAAEDELAQIDMDASRDRGSKINIKAQSLDGSQESELTMRKGRIQFAVSSSTGGGDFLASPTEMTFGHSNFIKFIAPGGCLFTPIAQTSIDDIAPEKGLLTSNDNTTRLQYHDGTQWQDLAYLSEVSGGGAIDSTLWATLYALQDTAANIRADFPAPANTDLTFSGASSPFTLESSTGTDVTIAQGAGVVITRSSNELTIAANSVSITSTTLETAAITGVKNKITLVDCSAAVRTVNPPASPAINDRFAVSDAKAASATYNITVDFVTASQPLYGASQNYIINANGGYIEFIYVDATTGWIATK